MVVIIFFLGGHLVCAAQKNTHRIIDVGGIEKIDINLDEVYKIKINSSKTSQIKIITHSEGEYYNDIALHITRESNTLKIKSSYPEILTGGYDKLSAHKVFSLEVSILIPENMAVNLTSNLASVNGSGKFKSFRADLKQGYCNLTNISGNVTVNTFKGNILVEANSGQINADTRHGKVKLPDSLPGNNSIKLMSIDGDITVRKN